QLSGDASAAYCIFFFQAEDGIRDRNVTGVQTYALPICHLGGDGLSVEGEVVLAVSAEPAGSGSGRDQRVHRIRRREAEHGAPGSAEGLDDMAEDLVRAVGGPDHLGLQRDAVTGTFVDGVEIGHEVFTQ